MIYSLPLEILSIIFKELPPGTDRLNFGLVCKKFLASTTRSALPSPRVLRILVSDCPCKASVSIAETCLSVCQCAAHGSTEIFQYVLPVLSKYMDTLELEDELANGGILDDHMALVLACCSAAPLTRLIMSRCDFSQVRPWTISMLAHFKKLQEISFDGCMLPLSEAQFIRSLAGSFDTLTSFEITDSRMVTDKLSRVISRSCPQLENFSVAGCPAVSTFTALALIESALFRKNHMLSLKLQNTQFDSALLERYMRSPLFAAGTQWRLRPASIDMGYEKHAILAEHEDARCVLIYV